MSEYVNLPEITYLEINNFNLYKDGKFTWNFDKKFNLFLGTNGLGKTTTISLIAYALVGFINKKEKDENNDKIRKNEIEEFTEILDYGITDKKYYKRYTQQKESTVSLKFKLGSNIIELTRDMLNHNINKLKINNDEIFQDQEKKYIETFEIFSGISIKNFIRILYTLLIRYEEAPSLLFRPKTQHTALRTLFFDSTFHEKFLNVERKYRSLDGDFRRFSDDLRTAQKKIIENEDLINKKNEELGILSTSKETKESQKEYNILKLEESIKNYEKNIINIEEQISLNEKLLNEFNSSLGISNQKKDKVNYNIEIIEEEISELEKRLYSYIYSSNSIYNLAVKSLKKHNDCIFCGSIIEKDKLSVINESIDESTCPFCHTKINTIKNNNEIDKSELNKKLEIKHGLLDSLKKINTEIDTLNSQINSYSNKLSMLYKELKDIRFILISINKDLDKLLNDKSNKEYHDLVDEIKKMRNSTDALINEFEKDSIKIYGYKVDYNSYESPTEARKGIGGIDSELKNIELEYFSLQDKSTKGIKEFESKIIDKFNKYNILKDEFTLEVQESESLEPNIIVKHNIFIPIGIQKGSNNVRDKANKLSKSELIVLDYAFRMALIEYYSEITGNKDIIIVFETSEGVFDFSNVKMFASILIEYSLTNKILLISNLSNAEYLKSLLTMEIPQENKRVLNFIEVSDKENIGRKVEFFKEKLSEIIKGVK